MQLVAYGAQDVYLTGNPQITFFKVVYRRHTNFSMESIEQTFTGTSNFDNKATCTISRNGDLIGRMYVEATLDGKNWAANVGHKLLKQVEIEIGGQKVDKHTSDWLHIWNELTTSKSQKEGVDKMIGADGKQGTLHIPLQFWFCRNPGLCLPLIALQYHEVKVNIEFNSKDNCLAEGADDADHTMNNVSLWVDYIYLDTDERRRFAQSSHEYLIEQLQIQSNSLDEAKKSHNERLNFNHPCKELIWTLGDALDYTTGVTAHPSAQLKLNGHDRFAVRKADYFQLVQPYQAHTTVPFAGDAQNRQAAGINVYSFAVNPEDHQPSGTCNFSRIDNAQLCLTELELGNNPCNLNVYAVNYNVLRIMSGMGGLAFSN
jgi:hypothetical protein